MEDLEHTQCHAGVQDTGRGNDIMSEEQAGETLNQMVRLLEGYDIIEVYGLLKMLEVIITDQTSSDVYNTELVH